MDRREERKAQNLVIINIKRRRNRIRYVFAGRDEKDAPFCFAVVALEQHDIDTPAIAKFDIPDESSVPSEALLESLETVERNEYARARVRQEAQPLEFNVRR